MRFGLLCALLVAVPALAGELKGVKMPDSLTLEGKELKLNGLGLRTKAVFKVYVAGLYLENKSKDPATIIAADEVRRVDLRMMRDLDKKTIVDAIKNGFEKNTAADKLATLKDRLDKFSAAIPDLKEGQTLTLVYVPGKGTRVEGARVESANAEGKDFADALVDHRPGRRAGGARGAAGDPGHHRALHAG